MILPSKYPLLCQLTAVIIFEKLIAEVVFQIFGLPGGGGTSDHRGGGVQQLISEQLQRQGDGVPETCPEHWDQHSENTTKW